MSTGLIQSEFAALLPQDELSDAGEIVRVSPGLPGAVCAAASAVGQDVTLADVSSLFLAAVSCRADSWQSVVDAAGLSLILGE